MALVKNQIQNLIQPLSGPRGSVINFITSHYNGNLKLPL